MFQPDVLDISRATVANGDFSPEDDWLALVENTNQLPKRESSWLLFTSLHYSYMSLTATRSP